MKRRDFVFKMSLIFIPCALKMLSTSFSPKVSSNLLKSITLDDSEQTIYKAGTFCFPKSPEIISSIYHLDVQVTGSVIFISNYDKINRHKQSFEVNGPGKFTAQYLGPDYGWSII